MRALGMPLDGFGGALLAGPVVRAVATRATRVTLLCGPDGAPAAGLLPHVDEVVLRDAPPPVPATPDAAGTGPDGVLRRLRDEAYDVALGRTPYGQRPLPTVRLLREAGVRRFGADHPRRPARRPPPADAGPARGPGGARHGRRPGVRPAGRARRAPACPAAARHRNRHRQWPLRRQSPGAGAPARSRDPERYAEAVALLADAVTASSSPADRTSAA